jgi:hypothetical protein
MASRTCLEHGSRSIDILHLKGHLPFARCKWESQHFNPKVQQEIGWNFSFFRKNSAIVCQSVQGGEEKYKVEAPKQLLITGSFNMPPLQPQIS